MLVLFFILVLVFFLVFMYTDPQRYGKRVPMIDIDPTIHVQLRDQPNDMLRNPYLAPERPTYSFEYTQLGYLQRDKRLPLFGKPQNPRRDMWYYYTIEDGIKLPLYVNRRKSTEFPGIASLSSGDTVYIDRDAWIVELYDINARS
jgi:hypothetical protein